MSDTVESKSDDNTVGTTPVDAERKDEAATVPTPDASAPSTDGKSANAQGEEALKSAKNFFNNLVTKYGKKRLGIASGALAVVLIVIVAAVALLGDGPSDSQIKADVEQADISWGGSGEFDSKEPFQVSSVDVTSKEKATVPSGFFGGEFGDTAYEVKAAVKASNGSVDSEAVVEVSYVKYEGKWQAFSSPSVDSKTSTPTAGITEDALKAGAQTILSTADGNNRMASDSLTTIYTDAKVDVDKVDFDKDAKTCTATMKYAVDGTFSSAKATVVASFTYEDNTWTLKSAKADDGASTISYDKLIGTWNGAFQETDCSMNANCFGAEKSTPALTITSIDPTSLKVEGTFSGLVHDHGQLESDANSSAGDTTWEPTAFTATLEKSSYLYGDIGATYTFPVNSDVTVKITFGFGRSVEDKDDPNGAFLKVNTYYQCDEDTMFLPAPLEKWKDVYRLTKAE